MTVIRMKGLPPALTGLTVRQNAASARLGRHQVEITASRTRGIAPAGVTFEARASGFDVAKPLHDLRYKWSFGDAHSGPFTALTERAAALGWQDSNTGYGPWAAHTFAPGPAHFARAGDTPLPALGYTVTCEVTDGTYTAWGRIEVTVDNPDYVFAGSRTLLFSSASDFSDAPADPYGGAYRWTADITDAYDAMNKGNARVLFRRGEEVEFGILLRDTDGPVHLGAWGSGASPRLWNYTKQLLTFRLGFGGEVAVSDLQFRNDYDPVTETGQEDRGGLLKAITIEKDAATDYTFHGIEVGGTSMGMLVYVDRDARWSCVVSDSRIHDFRDFGALIMDCDKFAFVGCEIRRHIDSAGGGAGALNRRGTYNDHGPLRIARPHAHGYVVLDALELFNNAGWSFSGENPAHQPCLRWNSDGIPGPKLSHTRCIAEGGNSVINYTTNKGGTTLSPGDMVTDKILVILTGAQHAFNLAYGGVTLRNFVAIRANIPMDNNSTSAGVIRIGWNTWDGGANAASFARVYSGTVVNWFDPVLHGNRPGGTIRDIPLYWEQPTAFESDGTPKAGTFAEVVVDNLVFHAPNMQAPTDASADIDLTQRLFAPYYKGLKWTNHFPSLQPDKIEQPTLDTAYAVPDTFTDRGVTRPLVVLPTPLPGGGAFAGALEGRVALDDLFGRLRGPRPSKGAVEPL